MDDPYEALRQQAMAKRDKLIASAHKEYQRTVEEIYGLRVLITTTPEPIKRKRKLVVGPEVPFHKLSVAAAVGEVLRERPMKLTEITVELQRRGIRSKEPPKKVRDAICNALQYYREKFVADQSRTWSLIGWEGPADSAE